MNRWTSSYHDSLKSNYISNSQLHGKQRCISKILIKTGEFIPTDGPSTTRDKRSEFTDFYSHPNRASRALRLAAKSSRRNTLRGNLLRLKGLVRNKIPGGIACRFNYFTGTDTRFHCSICIADEDRETRTEIAFGN